MNICEIIWQHDNTAISCEGPDAPDLCGSWGMQRPKPSKCGAASFLWASQRLGGVGNSPDWTDWSTAWCNFRGWVSMMISTVNGGWIKLWLVQSEVIVFIGLVCSESGRFSDFFCNILSQIFVCVCVICLKHVAVCQCDWSEKRGLFWRIWAMFEPLQFHFWLECVVPPQIHPVNSDPCARPRCSCFSPAATSPFFWPCHPWYLGGRISRWNWSKSFRFPGVSTALRWVSLVSWWSLWRLKQEEVAKASPSEWWSAPWN